jgi:peptide/nickel transport system substrate-binding protein
VKRNGTMKSLHLISVAALVTVISSCTVPGQESECEGLCGTLIVHTRTEVSTLYPPAFVEQTDVEVGGQIFIRLADLDTTINTAGDEGFVPRLARTWEFEDDVTLRFDLAPDATWHDGTPVTAEDVVFTFETYRDPATNAAARSLIDRIVGVEARDEHTAVFTFTNAYVEQFFDATHHMRILPKHRLDSISPENRRDHAITSDPIGSGPYRFVEWVANDRLELNAVEDHFEGPAGIRRLIWRTLPLDVVALDGLENETIDVSPQLLGPPAHQRVDAMETARTYAYPSSYYVYFGFNFTDTADRDRPHPIFGDRNVRRALAMAVDRQAIAAAVVGDYGSLPNSPAPPLLRTSSLEPEEIPFDVGMAKRTLNAAGWIDSDGDGVRDRNGTAFTFEVMSPSTSAGRGIAAVLLQEYFAAVGVEMEINEVPYPAWLARSAAGEFSAHMGTWQVTPAPAAIRGLWTRDAFQGLNWARYHNPEFDRLVEGARNERSADAENDMWRQAYSIFNQDAAAILVYTPHPSAAVASRISNVSIRGDEWAATLWTWRIAPDAMLPRDHVSR